MGAAAMAGAMPCQYNGACRPCREAVAPAGFVPIPCRSMFYDLSPALLHTLYLVAIVAEAMTAALSAGRRDMDWMGVCIIACVTALGGGSLRDVAAGALSADLGGPSRIPVDDGGRGAADRPDRAGHAAPAQRLPAGGRARPGGVHGHRLPGCATDATADHGGADQRHDHRLRRRGAARRALQRGAAAVPQGCTPACRW